MDPAGDADSACAASTSAVLSTSKQAESCSAGSSRGSIGNAISTGSSSSSPSPAPAIHITASILGDSMESRDSTGRPSAASLGKSMAVRLTSDNVEALLSNHLLDDGKLRQKLQESLHLLKLRERLSGKAGEMILFVETGEGSKEEENEGEEGKEESEEEREMRRRLDKGFCLLSLLTKRVRELQGHAASRNSDTVTHGIRVSVEVSVPAEQYSDTITMLVASPSGGPGVEAFPVPWTAHEGIIGHLCYHCSFSSSRGRPSKPSQSSPKYIFSLPANVDQATVLPCLPILLLPLLAQSHFELQDQQYHGSLFHYKVRQWYLNLWWLVAVCWILC